MSLEKKTARIAGALFIVGTVAGLLSIAPSIDAPDYLTKASENETQVLIGAFFQFLMAAAYIGFAILLYPILKRYNESLAIGFLGFRLMAGVFNIIGVIIVLLLLTLSQEFLKAGASASSYFQVTGELLRAARDYVNHVAMILAQSLGGIMYFYIFYQARLVPRWLSVWGIAGATLAILASFLVMFHLIGVITPIYIVLNLPIALQEMVLAVWLIAKGLNSTAVAFETSKTVY